MADYDHVFKFGLEGHHLIFSQPIMLTLQTPDYVDGDIISVQVQHTGQ